ncbi:LuxR C-terminal-related transcriptional regulator [Streptomyces sp. NPDC005336]|uniref:LuxR C-terminal-related transcriptional regulator n=1 Tax=Streptomyces sp. NPDC005336 TaxID=3157035 RepID=UPI0033B5E6D2
MDAAAELLRQQADAGALDRQACALVLEAAGLPRPQLGFPAGLTEREVDVLRLAARGLSNKEIGAQLAISGRTIDNDTNRLASGDLPGSKVVAALYDRLGRGDVPGLLENLDEGIEWVVPAGARERVRLATAALRDETGSDAGDNGVRDAD